MIIQFITLAAWLVFAVSIIATTLFDLWENKVMKRLITSSLFIGAFGSIASAVIVTA